MTDQNEIALTVIVPTFNQRAAVCEIVSRLERALGDLRWEAVFIDDFSPDGTADEVRAAARVDTRVRLVSRHDRRGQTSAVVEGALAASTDVIAVIDGDLERDVSILSRLYACVASGEADLALSTVETDLAGAEGEVIDARLRVGKSRMSLSADGFGVDLTDPLDGLFAVRRAAIEGALLERSGTGLAVKLNLIVSEERRPMAATEPLLSVVVPTFNERDNVREMIARLDRTLGDIPWELIFVDDFSPDGTADVVRAAARNDMRVRLISRHNRRGLSSAVVEGALAASANIVAVMDGDLQHDESVLPQLYRRVASGDAEIALASRFLLEDGADGLSSDTRLKISNTGITLANKMFNLDLTDPLTGFFAMRRDVVERALPDLSETGFKILLDLIVSAKPRPKVVEEPFKFRERVHGESKLDNRVMYDFFLFFIEKKVSPFFPLPARFISFAMINAFGILIHLAVLTPMVSLGRIEFTNAQLAATVVAMGFNYSVNNMLTYRDRQLKGANFYLGFVVFAMLCSIGVIANIGVANMMHREFSNVYFVVPAVAGALVTVVWNYVATLAFVWGRTVRSRSNARRVSETKLGTKIEA